MSALEKDLQRRLSKLGQDEKDRLLAYVRELEEDTTRGVPGPAMRALFGSISAEDARQMLEAIEEGCEQVDPDAW